VNSLVLASRDADLDPPRCHLGVFLLAHEVDLGRPGDGNGDAASIDSVATGTQLVLDSSCVRVSTLHPS
jgi:hypothetical protein